MNYEVTDDIAASHYCDVVSDVLLILYQISFDNSELEPLVGESSFQQKLSMATEPGKVETARRGQPMSGERNLALPEAKVAWRPHL